MRAIWSCPTLIVLLTLSPSPLATPEYFASVANRALQLRGGARFSDVHSVAIAQLEQQVKRVMGSDPSLDLNVSAMRALPDPELLRILLLAVLGNFTSAAAPSWHQPCSLAVDPRTGAIVSQDQAVLASTALKVVVILLIAVQFRQWIREDQDARRASAPPSAQKDR